METSMDRYQQQYFGPSLKRQTEPLKSITNKCLSTSKKKNIQDESIKSIKISNYVRNHNTLLLT